MCFLKVEFIPNIFLSLSTFSNNLPVARNIFQKILLEGATKAKGEEKSCISGRIL